MNDSEVPRGGSDPGLTTGVHVVHAREFRGGAHRNAEVDAPELADRSEEFPILRLLRVMGGSRAQKFVAGAVAARAAVVHRRIPLLESDEQDQIHLLGRVGVAEEDGVLELRPPRPEPFREAMEGFFVLDDGGLNEGLGSLEEELPSALWSGHRADGAHLRNVRYDFGEHLVLVHPSPLPMLHVLIHRRPVAGRKKGVDLVFPLVDRQRVGPLLRWHGFEELHAPHVEDVNHSGVADRDIDMAQPRVEEDNVRRAAQFPDQLNLSRVQVNRDQLLSVTSAEELSPSWIEIEAMRSFGGHLVSLPDRRGSLRLDCHDEGRIRDVYVESGRPLVVHGPPRAPRKHHGCDHRLLADVNHRNGRRIADFGVAHVCNEQEPSRRLQGEAVGTDSSRESRQFLFRARCENTDRVLGAICGKEKTAFIRDENARETLQSMNGPKEPIGSGVDDVDIIVRRMGDVETRGFVMDRRVIEATIACVRGKLDVAPKAKAHRVGCSSLALPSTLRRQYAYSASYAGN